MGRSPSSRFPGQRLCWLVPRVCRELLTPDGRRGLPVCSSASAPPCVACVISTQRATSRQSQLRTPSLQTSAQRKDLVVEPSLPCCTEWGAEGSRYQFCVVHVEKQVLTKRQGSSCTKWVVTAATGGFLPGTNKAWAYFEQKTPPSVSRQTLVSPGLGAAHSIPSAATESTTGGD